ncbi:ceramide glucosyltransferase [Dyella jiangningensis]|uniref:bacteriohopanetetrol glucosamine biosynthesis glycosyltransferase HpnI n=1 Tax=Dyella sp. AtDHG13 TaxID=1938897 RepID=UPI00087F1C47|nr:bacteriohopanetetrol glucosamine biosynthesis glycosyltransferase HpnI [Dyella sp. AtDHG13]PXV60345.1 ceramide glucosyltransferase [Dyella sp. AtDHG13]SDJ41654.1 ceramide glucosyltransferase [Dyella jiangningensis]
MILALCAAMYAYLSFWAWFRSERRQQHRRADVNDQASRPVSVLKPLHGAEPRLYENLRSFCEQHYAHYELLFGVRDPEDPAIAVVQRLQREFPQLPMALVIDPAVHGANLKVSNLINLVAQARHDWLVLADSDISVTPDYLLRVTAPLNDPRTGIVTCLYHGVANNTLSSRLGRLFIDDWFAPSVRLAHAFGSTRFAFGSTIGLRRDALEAIGGFDPLKDTLADDFWLGERTRQLGLRTVLSDVVVGTDVSETTLASLWSHELRWLRTIRAISPAGFFFSFICLTWPLLAVALALSPSAPCLVICVLAAIARTARYAASWRSTARSSRWRDLWLTPFRDALLLVEWAGALVHWRVDWRGQVLHARDHAPSRYP